MSEASKPTSVLWSLAFSRRRGLQESKRDHTALPAEWDKGKDGRTLCGRPLGRWYFPRQERFTGTYSFQCSICTRVARRMELL